MPGHHRAGAFVVEVFLFKAPYLRRADCKDQRRQPERTAMMAQPSTNALPSGQAALRLRHPPAGRRHLGGTRSIGLMLGRLHVGYSTFGNFNGPRPNFGRGHAH